MRRAALAKVQLNRVRAPRAAPVTRDDEVDRAPADHTGTRELRADPLGDRRDLARVFGLGGEAAPEVALTARAAKQLVVRRHDLDLAVGRDVQLHARAAHLGAGDALLDDAPDLAEPLEVAVDGEAPVLESHRGQPLADTQELVGRARGGQAAQVDDRVAAPRDPLVELHDELRHARAP